LVRDAELAKVADLGAYDTLDVLFKGRGTFIPLEKPAVLILCKHYSSINAGVPVSILHLMLKYGANVRSERGKFNILQIAAAEGNDAAMSTIVSLAPDFLDSIGELDLAPLHIACENGHAKAVEKLLDLGARIDVQSRDGSLPILFAAGAAQAECIRVLARRGAKVNVVTEVLPRSSPPKYKSSPLYCTTSSSEPGRMAAMEALLACGADVNYAFGTQWRPIHRAAVLGDVAALQLFLKHGVELHTPLTNPDEYSRTALHKAVMFGQLDFVRSLVLAGINLNVKDGLGKTAVLIALQTNQLDMVKLLVDLKADDCIADDEGVSPVIYAAMKDMGQAILLLRAYALKEASISAPSVPAANALQVAAQMGHRKVVVAILFHFPDLWFTSPGSLDVSVRQMAHVRGHSLVVNVLDEVLAKAKEIEREWRRCGYMRCGYISSTMIREAMRKHELFKRFKLVDAVFWGKSVSEN